MIDNNFDFSVFKNKSFTKIIVELAKYQNHIEIAEILIDIGVMPHLTKATIDTLVRSERDYGAIKGNIFRHIRETGNTKVFLFQLLFLILVVTTIVVLLISIT